MAEYIEREKAIAALIEWETDPLDEEIEYTLKSIPAADVVEVKRGRWVDDPQDPRFVCEECGKWLLIEDGTAYMNFCPNCGADMREVTE